MILLEKRAEKLASKLLDQDDEALPPGFVRDPAPDELRVGESLVFPLFENIGTINGFPVRFAACRHTRQTRSK